MRRWSTLTVGLLLISACTAHVPPAGGEDRGMAVSFDAVPVAYEVHGARPGTAVVLVHGWSCDRTYWSHQLGSLAAEHTVVALDLAGHGESGRRRSEWTIPAFGNDVAAVVEALGLRRVVLVGHSMGGDVVTAAAQRLPGRVTGLVWVETYHQLGPGRSPESVEAFIAPFRANFPETTRKFVRGLFAASADRTLVERVTSDMASRPPEIAVNALDHSFSYSREVVRTLKEIGLPVIAINSDLFPTDVASMNVAGVKVMTMTGVGHFLQLEAPDRFNPLLAQAIDELAR